MSRIMILGGVGGMYGGPRGEYKCSWWRDLSEREHLENLVVDGIIILKWIFKKWDREAWIGFILLRIGTGGGRL
jgi:hypothetical protein